MMTVRILDCTLRDGGYYNKWEFESKLVKDYLDTMVFSNIDFVELGLRQFESSGFLGAHAFSTASYFNRLALPSGPIYGVMVDAKTILTRNSHPRTSVDDLFDEEGNEAFQLVRVAAHFDEVRQCEGMLSRLKEKGYTVGLNVMQASLKSPVELVDLADYLKTWNFIDVLYFAAGAELYDL